MNASGITPARRRLRMAALVVAGICVLALAAGAFAVSYSGVRDTALQAGIAADLARIYPGMLDAVLLVAGVAALSLRGVWRGYAWLVILVVIAAVAAADTVHVLSLMLPKRPRDVTTAVLPWAVLLVGFTLLYGMTRQGRPGRTAAVQAAAPGPESAAGGAGNGALSSARGPAMVPLSALLAEKPGAAAGHTKPPAAVAGHTEPTTAAAGHTEPTAAAATRPQPQAAAPVSTAAAKPTGPAATGLAAAGLATAGLATAGLATVPGTAVPAAAPPRLFAGRDDPSDADAEPSGAGPQFGHGYPVPPSPTTPADKALPSQPEQTPPPAAAETTGTAGETPAPAAGKAPADKTARAPGQTPAPTAEKTAS